MIPSTSFQELDLTAEALLLGDTSRAAPWEQLIQTTLRALGPYTKVMTKQLVGMLLCIFVLDRHLPAITEVKSSNAGVGIMGMMVWMHLCDRSTRATRLIRCWCLWL